MSPRSLFIIILRVLGIFSLKDSILSVFGLFPDVFRYSQFSRTTSDTILVFAVQLIIIAAFWAVSWVLIFKAAYLVDRFDLSRDISPALQFNLRTRDVLRIALIITAGILLALAVPAFISQLIGLFEPEVVSIYAERTVDWSPVITSGVKVVIGLLMIGERKKIIEFFLKDQAEETAGHDDPEPPVDQSQQDLFPEH
jgi:hypothetical protein